MGCDLWPMRCTVQISKRDSVRQRSWPTMTLEERLVSERQSAGMKGCRKQRIERVGLDTRNLLACEEPFIGWEEWVFIPRLGQRPHGEPDSLELLGAVEVFLCSSFEVRFLTALVG